MNYDDELTELKKPNCAMDCGGFYAEYKDPTGLYSHGKVEELLVDPRADMFIKRLLAYIEELTTNNWTISENTLMLQYNERSGQYEFQTYWNTYDMEEYYEWVRQNYKPHTEV